MTTEVIQIVTEMIDNVTGQVTKINKSIQNMNGVVTESTNVIRKNKQGLETYNTTTNKVTSGLHRFQMQWLSILFFGMAINRMFNGLIKTSLEWVGINELMTTTLGVFFLPVAEQLLEFLLPIFDWFMNLPEPVQKVIGWFVVFAAVIGGLLSVLGQFALGLAGIQWLTAASGIGKIGTAASTAAGASGVGALLSILQKVAGIGLITVSFALAISSLKEENMELGILKAIGAGIAAAVGGVLLGASLSTGLIIGGVIATILISYQFSKASKERTAGYNKIGKDVENAVGSYSSGTRMTTPNIPEEILNTKLNIGEYLSSGNKTSSGTVVSDFNVTYNVNVSDKREFEEMLRKNNDVLTKEVLSKY